MIRLIFLFVALILGGIYSQGKNIAYMHNTELVQLGFPVYPSDPAGAYNTTVSSGSAVSQSSQQSLYYVVGTTTNIVVLPVGTYNVFLKVSNPGDKASFITAQLGGSSTTPIAMDDRDSNLLWQGPLNITTSVATNKVSFRFDYNSSIGLGAATIIITECYITDDMNEFVLGSGEIQQLHIPLTSEYDNTPAVKGNQIQNSSFEVGTFPFGYWWSEDRDTSFYQNWRTNTIPNDFFAHSGTACVKLSPQPNNGRPQAISLPISLNSKNKTNCLSIWLKNSTTGGFGKIQWVNTGTAPSGFTSHQILETSFSGLGTAWTRFNLVPDRFKVQYDEQGYIIIEHGSNSPGELYIDDIQLEQGTLSNYDTLRPVEYGLITYKPGNVYTTNESITAELRVYNSKTTATNITLYLDIYDRENNKVANYANSYSIPGGGTTVFTQSLATGKQGIFLAYLYETNYTGVIEYSYSIVPPRKYAGIDHFGLLGSNAGANKWMLDILYKLGYSLVRAFSPWAQFGRWGYPGPSIGVERTDNVYTYDDAPAALATNALLSIVGNFGEQYPTFHKRNYLKMTNMNAGWVVGEVARGEFYTGTVTLVLGASDIVGTALQCDAASSFGTALAANVITGLTSGATGMIKSYYSLSPALDKWGRFFTNAPLHYTNVMRYAEIDNEPNQEVNIPHTGQQDEEGFYAEMLKRAVIAITNQAPTVKIVGMGGAFDQGFITNVMTRLGVYTNAVDFISGHFYPGSSPVAPTGTSEQSYANAAKLWDKPWWNSESGSFDLGLHSGPGANQILSTYYPLGYQNLYRFYKGRQQQVELLAYMFLRTIGNGLGNTNVKFFQYDFRNSSAAPNNSIVSGLGPFTGVDWDDTPKGKVVILSTLVNMLEHGRGMGKHANVSAPMECYIYDVNGVGVAALWSTNFTGAIITQSGLARTDYKVVDAYGNSRTTNGFQIPFDRMPTIIVGVGITHTTLSNALTGATVAGVTDTTAPNLAITYGPRGNLTLGSDAFFRLLAVDNKNSPSTVEPDSIQYDYYVSPTSGSFPGTWSGNGLITSTGLNSGIYTLNARAKDSAGNISSTSTRKFVILNADGTEPSGGNNPPVLANIGNKIVDELALLSFQLSATDPENNTFIFTLDPGGPSGISIQNNAGGMNTWSNLTSLSFANPGVATTYPSPITVSGLAGPITAISIIITNYTHPFTKDIDVLLSGPTGIKTWLMSDVGNNSSVSGLTLTFNESNTTNMSQNPTLISGTYKPTNYEGTETMPSPAPGTTPENYTTNLVDFIGSNGNGTWNLWARDCCLGDIGTIGGWYLILTTAQGANVTWTPTESQGPGSYSVNVRVTDGGGGSDTELVGITVNEVNTAPILSAIGNKVGTVGSNITFNASALDNDLPIQTLTYSLDVGNPPGSSIGSSSGIFSWTPSASGISNITVRVTDSGSPALTDFETISINVSASPGPVPPPPPTNLQLSIVGVSSNQLVMTWTDNSSTETGFKIQRKILGGIFNEIVQTAANSISYTNTSLLPSTTYVYRVSSFNTGGDSAFSNEASGSTTSIGADPLGFPTTATIPLRGITIAGPGF